MQTFNKEYAEKLFHNCQKIAVIGNAQSAIESKNGKVIDDCDVVCRFNCFKLKGFEEFVGHRTDVYVTNLICNPVPFIKETHDLKFVLVTRPFSVKHYYNVALGEMLKNLKYLEDTETVFISNEDFEILYEWLEIPLNDETGRNPSSGLVLIYLLSKYLENVEFFLSGFEFFSQNKKLHYFDKKNVTDELKYFHEPIKEMNIFIQCLNGRKVTCDDRTKEILFDK